MQPNYHPHPGRPQQQNMYQPNTRPPPQQMRPVISQPMNYSPNRPNPGPGQPIIPSQAQPMMQHQFSNTTNTSPPRYANRLAASNPARSKLLSNSNSNRSHANMSRGPTNRSYNSSRTRRTNQGGLCPGCDCSFNSKYAMSMQGLCKALQIVCLLVTWSVIASTPYWRRYFIIGGYTWPFHIVMLLTISLWIATLFLYVMFLLGWHFSYRSIAWPGVELWYNLLGLVAMILAAVLQSMHVWRWDYRNGLPLQSQMPLGYTGSRQNGMNWGWRLRDF